MSRPAAGDDGSEGHGSTRSWMSVTTATTASSPSSGGGGRGGGSGESSVAPGPGPPCQRLPALHHPPPPPPPPNGETYQGAVSLPHNQHMVGVATGHQASPLHMCKCSQCDPNYYTVPMNLLFASKVEYVCRDCQFSTLSFFVVQQHEVATGHRRWYNFPQ
ncbi:hypothetical protein GGF46_003213 [Coemansia sp. RSA 552]|nr:hypothetical protein GGF46_003213 [Coemansia sp. RSA 552]